MWAFPNHSLTLGSGSSPEARVKTNIWEQGRNTADRVCARGLLACWPVGWRLVRTASRGKLRTLNASRASSLSLSLCFFLTIKGRGFSGFKTTLMMQELPETPQVLKKHEVNVTCSGSSFSLSLLLPQYLYVCASSLTLRTFPSPSCADLSPDVLSSSALFCIRLYACQELQHHSNCFRMWTSPDLTIQFNTQQMELFRDFYCHT